MKLMYDDNGNALVSVDPISLKRLQDYATVFSIDLPTALERSIYSLTAMFWAEEGYPKKATWHNGKQSVSCWVLSASEIMGPSYYTVVDGKVQLISAEKIDIVD